MDSINITKEKDVLQTLYTYTHTFVIPCISFWGLLGTYFSRFLLTINDPYFVQVTLGVC